MALGHRRDRQRDRLRGDDGSSAHSQGDRRQPRRTIRVALWSGEEQGLLGSKAYVAQHFGTAENPSRSLQNSTATSTSTAAPAESAAPRFSVRPEPRRSWRRHLTQFEDLGIYGATATTSRNAGGTDSTSFNAAGLPGIGLGQDGIEYNSHTWHTNLDTYERIVEEDVKKSAVAIAYAVYQLAMSDEMLPRFTQETMPRPPATAAGGGQAPLSRTRHFKVVVVSDACTTFSERLHQANLETLHVFGWVRGTDGSDPYDAKSARRSLETPKDVTRRTPVSPVRPAHRRLQATIQRFAT